MIGAGVFLMPSELAAYKDVSTLGWLFSARDASILTNFGVIHCRMGKERRMSEPKLQESTCKKYDVPNL